MDREQCFITYPFLFMFNHLQACLYLPLTLSSSHKALMSLLPLVLTRPLTLSATMSAAKIAKLSDEQRKIDLTPVLESGWKVTEGRDAIKREFLF